MANLNALNVCVVGLCLYVDNTIAVLLSKAHDVVIDPLPPTYSLKQQICHSLYHGSLVVWKAQYELYNYVTSVIVYDMKYKLL